MRALSIGAALALLASASSCLNLEDRYYRFPDSGTSVDGGTKRLRALEPIASNPGQTQRAAGKTVN